MKKTINLSRVRAEPRRKRAKKAVSIVKDSFEEEVKISRELNEQIWRQGIENPPQQVEVTLEDGKAYPVRDE